MSQHYMNPADANDPKKLPNILTMQVRYGYCDGCDGLVLGETGNDTEPCEERACRHEELRVIIQHVGWFYWFCMPGCMPDTEPIGPFDSEAEALEDARKDHDW
jgi:hypothetical protein